MNKAIFRKVGGQPLQISPNHGLLYASQVQWLLTANIKNIDHRRTLVLNIYSRELALGGQLSPVWTVFQTSNDYITMEHKDGSIKWRTCALNKLSGHYNFSDLCAFVSRQDAQRVTRFCRDNTRTGLSALMHRQSAIQAQRRAKREKQKQQKIAARMRVVPAVPRGLQDWVQRKVVPAYIVLDKQDSRKVVPGVCTACGKVAAVSGAKHNENGVCPHCGREVTYKSRARVGHISDRETVEVIQRTVANELVIRIFKAYNAPLSSKLEIYESIRQFVRLEPNGDLAAEDYYLKDGNWKQGVRPLYFFYQYQFAADTCGYLYCGNIPNALRGTPWQYAPIADFARHFSDERMEARPFLMAHIKHPKLEHLCKVGFHNLASDLAYRSDTPYSLDESQNRTHRILGVAAEDVAFLRELDVGLTTLQTFIGYNGLKGRQELLRWQLKHDVKRDIPEILRHTTPHKMMRYLDLFLKQYTRPDNMQYIVTEYRDYLEMAQKLNYDLRNDFVLFPKNLKQAHDRAAKQVKVKADALMRRNFKLAYKRIMSKLDYEQSGMKILYPGSPEEIVAEGQALHHCVGSYVDRVARQECIIVFLRQTKQMDKPYYTVEIRDRHIVQARTMKNEPATPEVQRFLEQWERKVLCAAA